MYCWRCSCRSRISFSDSFPTGMVWSSFPYPSTRENPSSCPISSSVLSTPKEAIQRRA
jgi:hypothetical protein